MCCCKCLDRLATTIMKIFNVILLLVGLGGLGYSVYLATAQPGGSLPPSPGPAPGNGTHPPGNGTKPQPGPQPTPHHPFSVPIFPAATGGMGGLVAILAGFLLACGHRSPCYLKTYCFFMSLVLIAQSTVAVLFLMPNTKDKLINGLELTSEEKKFIETNILFIGYALIGVAGLELISVLFAWCHRGFLIDEEYDDDGYRSDGDTSRSLLGRRNKKGKVELGSKAEERRDNFRSKYAHLYEKYNISAGNDGDEQA